jgi:hypothetical protein
MARGFNSIDAHKPRIKEQDRDSNKRRDDRHMTAEFKENAFDDLYRIIDIVARSRYNAQRRLLLHAGLAQFTLTFLSIALIIIPLLDLGGLNTNYSAKYVQIMLIVFAVVLLGYSLLLTMGRFEVRAERMHGNGLALSRILRVLKSYLGSDVHEKQNDYNEFVTRYYECLEKAENYRQVDYHCTILDQMARQGIPGYAGGNKLGYVYTVSVYFYRLNKRRVRVYSGWMLGFSHYLVAVAIIYIWIFLMVYPTKVH